jgi:hypothetical protein
MYDLSGELTWILITVWRKKYRIKNSNKFAAMENLNDSEDMNGDSENIKKNIKTSTKVSLGLYDEAAKPMV